MKWKTIGIAVLAVLFLAVAYPAWTIYYDIYGTNALLKGDLYVTRNADVIGDLTTAGLYVEGDTADAYETKIAAEDPTADRTATLPDYTGSVPIVVDQSGATETCNSGTSTYTDTAVTPPAGWWVDGKTLMWEIAGTLSGQNAAKVFTLSVGTTNICSITTAANAEGDFRLRATVKNGDGTDGTASGVTEIATLELSVASGDTVFYTDVGTSGVSDFASGTTNFEIRATSGNAGDQIFKRLMRIWHWFKA